MGIEVGSICYDLHESKLARVISRRNGKYGTWSVVLEDLETGERWQQSGSALSPSEVGYCPGEYRLVGGSIHEDMSSWSIPNSRRRSIERFINARKLGLW